MLTDANSLRLKQVSPAPLKSLFLVGRFAQHEVSCFLHVCISVVIITVFSFDLSVLSLFTD